MCAMNDMLQILKNTFFGYCTELLLPSNRRNKHAKFMWEP